MVGVAGLPGGFGAGGLAFANNGNLYATLSTVVGAPSTLYKLDPATGTATLVGPIGFPTVTGIRFQNGPSSSGGGSGGGPVGVAGEGSFAGVDPPSHPHSGSEGSFAMQGSFAVSESGPRQTGPGGAGPTLPALLGPFLDSAGGGLAPPGLATAPPSGSHLRVFNVSGPARGQTNGQHPTSSTASTLAWVMLAALVLVGAVALAKKVPTATATAM